MEEELKRVAESLRVPVSNVVRAMLEDALRAAGTVSERVEGELRGFVERVDDPRVGDPRVGDQRVVGQPETPATSCPDAAGPLEEALAFDKTVLNRSAHCDHCGKGLPRGSAAYHAVFQDGRTGVFVAANCRHLPR